MDDHNGALRRRRVDHTPVQPEMVPLEVRRHSPLPTRRLSKRHAVSSQYFFPRQQRGILLVCLAGASLLCLVWPGFVLHLFSDLGLVRLDSLSKTLSHQEAAPWRNCPIMVFIDDDESTQLASEVYPVYSFQAALSPLEKRTSPTSSRKDKEVTLRMTSLVSVNASDFKREVDPRDEQYYDYDRRAFLRKIDGDLEEYYRPYFDIPNPRDCVRPEWSYQLHPTCNGFHESLIERAATPYNRRVVTSELDFIGSGYYRNTWFLHERYNPSENSTVVLKRMRLFRDFIWDEVDLSGIESEARVLALFTSSPFFTNVYGHCGTSLVVHRANEVTHRIVPKFAGQSSHMRGRMAQGKLSKLELESPDGIVTFNNFTLDEKLRILIEMTASLALLHGHPEGAMMHDDMHIDQWLMADDGTMVLNDINNVAALEWNEKNNSYCKFYSKNTGSFRAPEQFKGANVDETADMWPVGNLIFSVLTGLFPYYNEYYPPTIQRMAMDGIPPYVNPKFRNRTMVERRLVEVMYDCYKLVPEERSNIFTVLKHLKETQRLYEQEKQSQE